MQETTLGDLIESSRHSGGEKSLTYAELSKRCGGTPTAARLQQYVSEPIKNFPGPETIRNLAKGTGYPEKEIVLASARSLGLQIDSDLEDLIYISGASSLPSSATESLKSIGRELVNLSLKADHAEQPAASTQPPRKLRAVESDSDHPGTEQKTPAGDSVVKKLHAWDAEVDTTPPGLDKLAALTKFKTHREKFDDAHGERGEESQDSGEVE